MTAESITVSLEWAKKLKEAGWEQEGFLWWHQTMSGSWEPLTTPELRGCLTMRRVHVYYAAPTAEEILRRLPKKLLYESRAGRISGDGSEVAYELRIYPIKWKDMRWRVGYDKKNPSDTVEEFEADTLANAAAAMYCHCAEQKLLPAA
jgi:hypothetical protein